MTDDPAERFRQLLETKTAEACEQLFLAYGQALSRVDAKEPPRDSVKVCGVVGFIGNGLRGCCLLALSEEPLIGSNPARQADGAWAAELANQLLGRVKNKLLQHGATIHLTTPVALRGEHIAPLPRVRFDPIAFCSPHGNVLVWIDSEVDGSFRFGETSSSESAANEGDLVMF